jgi:hypothetical protein
VLFNTATRKKYIDRKNIAEKWKSPRHRLNLDKIKPKKDLTIDTMGNTEKYRGNSFSFTAIFHLLASEAKKCGVVIAIV